MPAGDCHKGPLRLDRDSENVAELCFQIIERPQGGIVNDIQHADANGAGSVRVALEILVFRRLFLLLALACLCAFAWLNSNEYLWCAFRRYADAHFRLLDDS